MCAYTHAHAQVLYEISGNSTLEKSYLLATNKLINITFIDTIPNVLERGDVSGGGGVVEVVRIGITNDEIVKIVTNVLLME